SFVADGAIAIAPFTHVFVAGPVLPPVSSVSRVSPTPRTETVVCAETVVTPVVADVSVIVHEPEPPAVVHGFGVPSVPGPESLLKLIEVPSGAFTKPAPEPSFTSTCAVNVCVWPTRFVPFGEIEIRASTTFSGSHAPSDGL